MARLLSMSDLASLEAAVRELRSGGLAAFATDTVYGVGSLPTHEGTAAIYRAKGRPLSKPIPLLLSSVESLEDYACEVPLLAIELARRCWPGALTMVLRGRSEVAEALGARDGTIAFRVPDHSELRRLIDLAGGALAVTSANVSGGANTVTADEVDRQIGEHVTLVLDGGACRGGSPSTLVNLATSPPRILRSGPLDGVVQSCLER